MTPEERFNNELLYVLNQIKQKALYTRKDRYIEYWVSFVEDNAKITAEKESLILDKLEELGAIKIISKDASPSDIMVEAYVYSLEIKQPKFDELYDELREPLRKKEEYEKKSVESLNKILGVLKHLKDEWDITPNQRTRIAHNKCYSWVQDCGLNDFYELDSILTILQQEELILEAKFINEAR